MKKNGWKLATILVGVLALAILSFAAVEYIETLTCGDLTVYDDATVTDDLAVNDLDVAATASFTGATTDDLGTVTTADINGGTVDGAVIGGSSAAAGTFTAITGTSLTLTGTSDTWDPASLGDGAQESKDFTVSGAALGDAAIAGAGVDVTDLLVSAVVTNTDTVTVTLANETGGAVDLASSTWYVYVILDD